MPSVFYPRFEVCRIAADGERIALPAETVSVYNVTASSSLGTLVSDADSMIDSGSVTADIFDIIEISHATYPLTCRFTLAETEDEAYTLAENHIAIYIAENLYTDRTESKSARLYAIDLDNPDVAPQYLADLKPGVTTEIPYQTSVAKNLRLAMVSQDILGQYKTNDIALSEQTFDINIPAVTSGPSCLFDHFTDATAATTGAVTLWLDQINAGRLATNGDKITLEYSGIFAATVTERYIRLKFGGTQLFDSSDLYESGTHWKMTATLIRVSNTVLRSAVHFETSNPFTPVYTEVTGLNLTTTDYDIEFIVDNIDDATDITAKMGHGLFIPAATTNTNDITYLGEAITFGGEALTFTGA